MGWDNLITAEDAEDAEGAEDAEDAEDAEVEVRCVQNRHGAQA